MTTAAVPPGYRQGNQGACGRRRPSCRRNCAAWDAPGPRSPPSSRRGTGSTRGWRSGRRTGGASRRPPPGGPRAGRMTRRPSRASPTGSSGQGGPGTPPPWTPSTGSPSSTSAGSPTCWRTAATTAGRAGSPARARRPRGATSPRPPRWRHPPACPARPRAARNARSPPRCSGRPWRRSGRPRRRRPRRPGRRPPPRPPPGPPPRAREGRRSRSAGCGGARCCSRRAAPWRSWRPRPVTGTRPGRPPVDLSVVNYTGEVVAGLRRLGGAVGPRITLPPAMALRSAMAALARSAPEVVTSQALTAYGDLTQLIGWLMFNLGDHKSALYYYDDARAAAHRAGSHDLVAYALAATGHLEIHRRRPRHAIDHAQAAWQAAKASGSPYALAYAADVTARAYAAAGQVSRCHAALDRERDALLRIGAGTPRAPWWYFYDESFYWGTESECALKLDMPVEACDAARQALGLVEPHNLHNSALTLAFRAEALIRQGEVEEACRSIADAARYTTMNSSKRISRRIEHLRRQLRGAEGSAAVRELDDKLAEYRRARAAAGVPPGLPGWGRVP